MHFQTDSNEQRTKALYIGNSRLVQDSEPGCWDVAYYPDIELNRSWLPQGKKSQKKVEADNSALINFDVFNAFSLSLYWLLC